MKRILLMAALSLLPLAGSAQQILSLEDCRRMAIEGNKDLEQARTQVEMAGYDRKIAFANYLPQVSAIGTYQYIDKNISLLSENMSETLLNAGTLLQNRLNMGMQGLQQVIMSNPILAQELANSPLWQTVFKAASSADIATGINAIGAEINNAFTVDIHNIFAGGVTLKQPVFVGGKIINANRVAKLAEELARSRYSQEYQQVVVDVDQAYWQIVSVANKKQLAESYADLLHHMEKDVNIAVDEGVSTESDALQIKVKANEADMLLTKATNGLILAKMLLCKQIGLPLDSEITLADESLGSIPVPQVSPRKDIDAVYADRPEIRSLDLAAQIYDGKANMVRADMMPKVAVTAGYLVTNPNLQHGIQHKFAGTFNAGVMVEVPIFHGFEALNKTRKARAEASLYRSKLEDAKNLINLQVSQLYTQQDEAQKRLIMAESNLKNAEENLRKATIGFEAGVVDANTALAAHTAWLQAHSEYIDAGVELQMNKTNLQKAEGEMNVEL